MWQEVHRNWIPYLSQPHHQREGMVTSCLGPILMTAAGGATTQPLFVFECFSKPQKRTPPMAVTYKEPPFVFS